MNHGSKYDLIVEAVRPLPPGDTYRHFLPRELKGKPANWEVSRLGTHIRRRGVKVSLRRYEHIVVITRLEA